MENGDDDADEKDDQIELSGVAWVVKTWTYFVTLINYTCTFIPERCVYLAVDGAALLQAWEQEQGDNGDEKYGDSKLQNSSKLINDTKTLM